MKSADRQDIVARRVYWYIQRNWINDDGTQTGVPVLRKMRCINPCLADIFAGRSLGNLVVLEYLPRDTGRLFHRDHKYHLRMQPADARRFLYRDFEKAKARALKLAQVAQTKFDEKMSKLAAVTAENIASLRDTTKSTYTRRIAR